MNKCKWCGRLCKEPFVYCSLDHALEDSNNSEEPSTSVQVYLPVAIDIDTTTGEVLSKPYIDFEGAPWMYVDSEENIWRADLEDHGEYSWFKDQGQEAQAIDALDKILEHWGDK